MPATQITLFSSWTTDLGVSVDWEQCKPLPDHIPSNSADTTPEPVFKHQRTGPIYSALSETAGFPEDHSTFQLIQALASLPELVEGKVVCDIGCGTGLLNVAAAKLGAVQSIGTEVVPQFVDLAQATGVRNEVTLDVRLGSLLDPLKDQAVDLMITNLPTKPDELATNLPMGQRGGPEGLTLTLPFARSVRSHIRPGGYLLLFVHTLAHPLYLQTLGKHFNFVALSCKRRYFDGLSLDALNNRHKKSLLRFWQDEGGPYFCCAVLLGSLRD